jgi:uncharacterized membrane protein YeaQ/YmgE (transglycosylase-associated protein family)
MGIALWTAAGLVISALVRMIAYGRPDGIVLEIMTGIAGAIAFGLLATYLDFGGWRETDWRAPLFAACGALALIALVRFIRLARRLRRI